MDKIRVGITIGDVNGIGPEVLIKAVSDPIVTKICIPVIYGSAKVISYHKNIAKSDSFFYKITHSAQHLTPGKINLINCWTENVSINMGKASETGGKYAKISLDSALYDLKQGYLDALVTSPINKEAMALAGFGYMGHTDYLAAATGVEEVIMMMIKDDLRVALATHHVPLRDVAAKLDKDYLVRIIEKLNETLIRDFDKERPLIAVLGLNPHAGDGGVIGNEEQDIIRPAVLEAKESGIFVNGPFPADSFWGSLEYKKYDVVLAMYHDQGLVPFKLQAFGSGVNYTAGLPFVRTSPDHGTGYDIVGKGTANHESFLNAIINAVELTRNRREYEEARKNRLEKSAKPPEEIDE